MAMTMTIERVMAFMGLDVLVARDEGLFEAEGLDLRIAALPPEEIRSAAEGTEVDRFWLGDGASRRTKGGGPMSPP